MPTRLTNRPLPKPSEIRAAIEELWEDGQYPLLDKDGVRFAVASGRPVGRPMNIGSRPSWLLTTVIRNFGVPPQIRYYESIGFDVRWDGVNDAGEWLLTLIDRRPDTFRDVGGKQIAIDAHYVWSGDG